MIYIIGAGGVGSWLCPAMCLLTEPGAVCVLDGDKLEEKNLNRQLFTRREIGQNKAKALAKKYGCKAIPDWFAVGTLKLAQEDWLIGAVDNNAARKAILETVDSAQCAALTGANEVTSAEAYAYFGHWHGTRLDPRTYYPEIITDRTADPRAASIGCTGAVQRANRQLVSANYMAAALIQHLYVAWAIEGPKLGVDMERFIPHKLNVNLSRIESTATGTLNQNNTPETTPQP